MSCSNLTISWSIVLQARAPSCSQGSVVMLMYDYPRLLHWKWKCSHSYRSSVQWRRSCLNDTLYIIPCCCFPVMIKRVVAGLRWCCWQLSDCASVPTACISLSVLSLYTTAAHPVSMHACMCQPVAHRPPPPPRTNRLEAVTGAAAHRTIIDRYLENTGHCPNADLMLGRH